MNTEAAGQGGRVFSVILRFLHILILNSWRRLLILGRYSLICFQQFRLRRAWRLLGKRLHQMVDGGEVYPMTTEEVQESLTRAQIIQGNKDRHYQAIAALREKIKASRAKEGSPPPEVEPAPAGEADPEKLQD